VSAASRKKETGLTVAVTGPTGTFGFGLVPLLEADDRVARVVGVARRPFDPAEHGWTKMEYHQGDVRDEKALEEAFAGADVVVHLAFLIVGARREVTRSINVAGTLNVFRAAGAAGARRFVYSSSVAAYGFHRDNPVGMTEEWPVRPAERLFYAQEKAEIEELLEREDAEHALGGVLQRLPFPVPAPVPDIPMQLVHEDDVGQALLQCVLGVGPPGAYNIAADDLVSSVDVARELGVLPLPLPEGPSRAAARLLSRLPVPMPAAMTWVEAASQPAIMDTARARTELGWEPRWTALEALRDALAESRGTG
jgi:nucleoside-diphosphate-sugar epimerase